MLYIADKEFNPQKTNKGDLLQARNLSRYLNQVSFILFFKTPTHGKCYSR